MSLTDIMFVAIPVALAIFKSTALSLAAVWPTVGAFEQRVLLPVDHRQSPLTSTRTRAQRG